MYGQNVGIAQAVSWMKTETVEMRRELAKFHGRLTKIEAAPMPSKQLPSPQHQSPQQLTPSSIASGENIDIPVLRASIEAGLRAPLRSSLLAELQHGMKEERQLTESALMIRYDAMVSRMVRDHLVSAVDQLRAVIDDAISTALTTASELAAVERESARAAESAKNDANTTARLQTLIAYAKEPKDDVDCGSDHPECVSFQPRPPLNSASPPSLAPAPVKLVASSKRGSRSKRVVDTNTSTDSPTSLHMDTGMSDVGVDACPLIESIVFPSMITDTIEGDVSLSNLLVTIE